MTIFRSAGRHQRASRSLLKPVGCCVLMLVASTMMTDIAAGQAQLPVRMRLQPLSVRGRSGGPIPLQIKLEYNEPQIREGDLLLKVYNSLQDDDELMVTIRYEGIVLQGQDYIFNTILPPMEASYAGLYLVEGWFETKDERIPLTSDPDLLDPPEPHELLSVNSFERTTLVCACSGAQDFMKTSANLSFLSRALSLENYNPAGQRSPRRRNSGVALPSQHISYYTAPWGVLTLPEDPLHLFCFDVVVLADGALGHLSQTQLDALSTWLKAGGSLCVLPDSKRLNGSHLTFLQNIFENESPQSPALTLANDNSLQVISQTEEIVINRRYGLGRATLLPNVVNLESKLTDVQLGQIVTHLWKVRSNSTINDGRPWQGDSLEESLRKQGLEVIQTDDGFVVQPIDTDDQYQGFGAGYATAYDSLEDVSLSHQLATDLSPTQSLLATTSETELLPDGIEMVPTSLIGLLLVAYVIAIGPVDYFVLGYFRARKYTWIVFPVVTLAFTILTVSIAHQYMAASDTGGTLTIIDLAEDGQPVRQTDVQMHFHGASSQVDTDCATRLLVPTQLSAGAKRTATGNLTPQAGYHHFTYSGRFPQRYTTSNTVAQWTPQLTRSTTLSVDATGIPPLDWSNPELVTTDVGIEQLRQQLTQMQTNDTQVDAVIIHRSNRTPIFERSGFLFSNARLAAQERILTDYSSMRWNRSYAYASSFDLQGMSLIRSASNDGSHNMFGIVSQVSPQGGATMEDLPIADSTDPDTRLLMVAIRQGGHLRVYRRLYHGNKALATIPLSTMTTHSPAPEADSIKAKSP